ncbi:MAG: hypothetical protein K2Y23_07080 [Cyanobacteria bacterium]|nr:hypothetical protein [Cyanobacteriota bacterium]
MNRRAFVSRVTLGGVAAACTGFRKPVQAAGANQVNVRFVGMMSFVERADRSFLVATPGNEGMHHMTHTPFLMARKGSAIAAAFDMTPAPGVVPEAFDTALIRSNPSQFVYRNLENTALDIVSGAIDKVDNRADELGLMNRIAPNKRVRGNLEKWASSTVSIRGGKIENSAAHPDAHKVWTFGSYSQRLTDAVNFSNVGAVSTSIRLTSAADARTFTAPAGEAVDLWVISAAQPGEDMGEPTTVEHSRVMFDYLVDATPVIATCAEATGRLVPPTELPFVKPTSASNGLVASAAVVPPWNDICWMGAILLGK